MNIIVEEQISKVLEVGDIANIDGYMYFVVCETEEDKYILRRFDEYGYWRGYSGYYNTLEDLTNSIEDENITIYSKNDYEFILRRK